MKWDSDDDDGNKNKVRFILDNKKPFLKFMTDSDKVKGYICEVYI